MTDWLKGIEDKAVCWDPTINDHNIEWNDVAKLINEVKDLRCSLYKVEYLVDFGILPVEDTPDRDYPDRTPEQRLDMIDRVVSRARGTEDA